MKLYRRVSDAFRKVTPIAIQVAAGAIILSSFIPWVREVMFKNEAVTVPVIGSLAILAFRTLLSAAERERPGGAIQRSATVSIGNLGAALTRFASGSKLTIDIFAYSTETFFTPLDVLFSFLQEPGHPVRSVDLRILMKDWDSLRFPPSRTNSAADDQGDQNRFLVETADRNKRFAEELQTRLEKLQTILRGRVKLTFEIRLYPFDPFHKGLIINRAFAYCGLYGISDGIFTKRPHVWDWQGKGVSLMEINGQGSPAEAQYLKSLIDWFDIVWNRFGVEVGHRLQANATAAAT